MSKIWLFLLLLACPIWSAQAQKDMSTAQLAFGYNYDHPGEHLGEMQLYVGRSFLGDKVEVGGGIRFAHYPDWRSLGQSSLLGKILSANHQDESYSKYQNIYVGAYAGYNVLSHIGELPNWRLLLSPTVGYSFVRSGTADHILDLPVRSRLTYGIRASLELMTSKNAGIALQCQALRHQTYSVSAAMGFTFHY